jgi:2-C-methyl-D-erythritol 2,4-cyclodiphosphate synthase
MNLRIGQGYDVHAFCAGDHIVVGGVSIPHTQGVAAHSDGDVLLHALCDALLGAAALGDIGHHFPDDDAAYANIDSRVLLRRTLEAVREAGYRPVNVDATVIAERPKMAPHIADMRANIAADLALDGGAVNIKATTTEKLGFVGRREGLAALAVVLLEGA